eukprot:8542014-Prorocentrum_lima.AAC.1
MCVRAPGPPNDVSVATSSGHICRLNEACQLWGYSWLIVMEYALVCGPQWPLLICRSGALCSGNLPCRVIGGIVEAERAFQDN